MKKSPVALKTGMISFLKLALERMRREVFSLYFEPYTLPPCSWNVYVAGISLRLSFKRKLFRIPSPASFIAPLPATLRKFLKKFHSTNPSRSLPRMSTYIK